MLVQHSICLLINLGNIMSLINNNNNNCVLVRQKVLTHHPDKQTAEAQESEGDDLFKCIKIGTASDSITKLKNS